MPYLEPSLVEEYSMEFPPSLVVGIFSCSPSSESGSSMSSLYKEPTPFEVLPVVSLGY